MADNKYEVRLLKAAEEDFTEIVTYIAADNPVAAVEMADRIENDLLLLSENPEPGRIPGDEDIRTLGYRYLIVQNYIIFYTIEERVILVHRILHGARNYKTLL